MKKIGLLAAMAVAARESEAFVGRAEHVVGEGEGGLGRTQRVVERMIHEPVVDILPVQQARGREWFMPGMRS